ncbi:MAG: lysine--tRNA ligase [Nanobdellota archaeon]
MEESDILEKEKKRKLEEIRAMDINPYPYSYKRDSYSYDIKELNSGLEKEQHSENKCSVAGRIISIRRMGRASFMHIKDQKGKIQLYLREDSVGKKNYKFLKKLDIGDFIGAEGEIFKTKTGEVSIYVSEYSILSKSLKPLPEKFHGLKDKELRYRQRYLDLIMNDEVMDIFRKRSIIIKAIREFLDNKGFLEVETPLLQTQYGGAKARPFETHINAWDMKMYLSISPELYLKRLLVGGFEKIYTICKNFRNEGVDQSHNPEFTMIEIYQAYTDYNDMMKLIEECYEYVSLKVNGNTKINYNANGTYHEVDLKAPWPRLSMAEAIKKYLSIDVKDMSKEELVDFATKNNLEVSANDTWGDIVIEIFELVEEKIIQPTHIYDHPKEGTPLCKSKRDDNRFNEQCEPIGFGMELGNMYSELNDPDLQEKHLSAQAEKGRGGDEEAHPMDNDFINAIKVGMPPTGGIGWGIDRMVMLLTGAESIRDVILFPTMKPEDKEETNS